MHDDEDEVSRLEFPGGERGVVAEPEQRQQIERGEGAADGEHQGRVQRPAPVDRLPAEQEPQPAQSAAEDEDQYCGNGGGELEVCVARPHGRVAAGEVLGDFHPRLEATEAVAAHGQHNLVTAGVEAGFLAFECKGVVEPAGAGAVVFALHQLVGAQVGAEGRRLRFGEGAGGCFRQFRTGLRFGELFGETEEAPVGPEFHEGLRCILFSEQTDLPAIGDDPVFMEQLAQVVLPAGLQLDEGRQVRVLPEACGRARRRRAPALRLGQPLGRLGRGFAVHGERLVEDRKGAGVVCPAEEYGRRAEQDEHEPE